MINNHHVNNWRHELGDYGHRKQVERDKKSKNKTFRSGLVGGAKLKTKYVEIARKIVSWMWGGGRVRKIESSL